MVFALPLLAGRFLVYAPLHGVALVANSALVQRISDDGMDWLISLLRASATSDNSHCGQPEHLVADPDRIDVILDLRLHRTGARRDTDSVLREVAARLSADTSRHVQLLVDSATLSGLPDVVETVSRAWAGVRFLVEADVAPDEWSVHPPPVIASFLSAIRDARRRSAISGSVVEVLGASTESPPKSVPFCVRCFAQFDCPGPLSRNLARASDVRGSSWCHVVRELLRDTILERIAAGDGLVWMGPARKFDNVSVVWPAVPGAPDDTLFPSAVRDPPALFPVLGPPWSAAFSRRGFLGMSLALGSVWYLLQASALGQALERKLPIRPQALLEPPRAARRVDPSLLSGVAIEVAPGDALEAGYRLRWFPGSDLDFPRQAFPPDPASIASFVAQARPEPVAFEWSSDPKPPAKKQGLNTGVPTAFAIYRRAHHESYGDEPVRLTAAKLGQLRSVGSVPSGSADVTLAFARRGPRRPTAHRPLYSWPAPVTEWPEMAGRTPPTWSRNASEVIAVRFEHLQAGESTPRPVHVARLRCRAEDLVAAGEMLIEAYADGELEPVWQQLIRPSALEGRAAVLRAFSRSHFDSLLFVSPQAIPFELQFRFMDDDMLLAEDDVNPKPGEWVLVNSTQFITSFSSWTTAKENVFRRMPTDRYTALVEAGMSNAVDALDEKYKRIFAKLQQAFVRLRYALDIGTRTILEQRRASAVKMRLDPHLLVDLWTLDPNVAALFGFYYADIPGQHNPSPPTLGQTYDYLITAEWMPPATRLGYVVQSVSRASTPAVPRPRGVTVEQLEGIATKGQQLLYQIGLTCSSGRLTRPEIYGNYDAVMFDVRRRAESETEFKLLTHDYDPRIEDEDERLIDSPLQAVSSPPYPETDDQRVHFTAEQLAALSAQDKLQANNAETELTAEEIAAYESMSATPLERFFRLPEPEATFQDWIEAPAAGSSKTLLYDVRAIDIFGRVSQWYGAREVTITHKAAPPEATNVRAVVAKNDTGTDILRVSWRLGARERLSGSPVDHFNVTARVVDTRVDLVRMLHVDLLGREPTLADKSNATAILDDPAKTVVDLIVALCATTDYASRWISLTMTGAQRRSALVNGLYHDLYKRAATQLELQQGVDTLAGGLNPEALVRDLVDKPDYVAPNPRRFRYWRDHILNTAPIPHVPPIDVTVAGSSPLVGTTIPLTIADAVLASPEIHARTAPWRPNGERLVTITTKQKFRDLPLLLDLPRYYAFGDLLDAAHFTVANDTYPVVGLETGEISRLTVFVPDSVNAPANPFAANAAGTLSIAKFKESFTWTQTLDANWLPELASDEELTNATDKVAALLERDQLVLRLSGIASLNITGREAWLSTGAWFQYTETTGELRRLKIYGFGTLHFDADHLRFGSRRLASTTSRILTLTNRTSAPVTVRAATAGSPFQLASLQSGEHVVLAAEGALPIEVRFIPSSAGTVAGTLSIETDVGTFSFGLSGTGLSESDNERSDNTPIMPRIYLAELTLEEVVRDDESPQADVDNPAPIFAESLLRTALVGGTTLPCEIRIPGLRKVRMTVDRAANSASLLSLQDAELAFEHKLFGVALDFATEFLSPIWSDDGSITASALVREQTALPAAPAVPAGLGTVCGIYRAEFPLPASTAHSRTLSTTVSVHTKPRAAGTGPTAWYETDTESLVSLPALTDVGAPMPTNVTAIPPTANLPWVDPFRTTYSSLPKFLENRFVTQVRLDLGDAGMMNGARIDFPANGDLQLFRAPLDALRLAVIQQMKAPVPADARDDPYFADYDDALPDERVVGVREHLNSSERLAYEVLSYRLSKWWQHPLYSLARVFSAIGVIPRSTGNPRYVDELPGIASGAVFYAIRTLQRGTNPTPLHLLPFKVLVPDLKPAAALAPQVSKMLGGSIVLRWPRSRRDDIYGYEIVRRPHSNGHAAPVPLATLYSDSQDKPPGSALATRAPLVLEPMKRALVVTRAEQDQLGAVSLFFSLQTWGITRADQILGLFASDTLPSNWEDESLDLSTIGANAWRSGASQISSDHRTLEAIDLPSRQQVILIYRDAQGARASLSNVSYHRIDLEGVPLALRSQISGIYPMLPLIVSGKRIPLLFGPEFHGLASASQIQGVYRAYPDPEDPERDGGFGAPNGLNHWTNTWPSGSANLMGALSADGRFVQGISLPDSTLVLIQYQVQPGESRVLRNAVPPSVDAASVPPTFYGILDQSMNDAPSADAANLFRITDSSDGEVRAIGVKLREQFSRYLWKSVPVRLRYGSGPTAHFDQGSPQYHSYVDTGSAQANAGYKIIPLRKVRLGESANSFRIVRPDG